MIRAYTLADVPRMTEIWNEVVFEANAFPQETPMTSTQAQTFFAAQSFTGVAEEDGCIAGLYILHPNNVGRCGHLANASYAVDGGWRGRHIGEQLVRHSMTKARELGFAILQFNAVVATNAGAIHLYEKLGFQRLGTIPNGYRGREEEQDIHLYYIAL